MNILKEILLNQLIRVPAIRDAAMKRHSTGISHHPDRLESDYAFFSSHCSIEGRRLLELGPGKTIGLVMKARANGARTIAIADILQYLTDEEIESAGIDYRVYDGKQLPFGDGSFDLIWSTSVFEHLRYPEITVSETYRLLSPGGRVAHLIDLVDHFSLGTNDPHITFNCLRYSQSTWDLMTWNRSNYVNRLRASEWIKMHEAAGFKIISSDSETSEYIRDHYRSDNSLSYLTKYSETDAISTALQLVAEK